MTDQQMDNQVFNNENQNNNDNNNNDNLDLTSYFKDGEPGVFDENKIEKLARDYENQKKSTAYFQSQFMKKNSVPTDIEGYAKTFKADSKYEIALQDEEIQKGIKEFREWALKNGIGERETNAFTDWQLKKYVDDGIIDVRSEDEIKEAQRKAYESAKQEAEPMLNSLGRTFEENNKMIDNFFNSPSVYTNNPEIKKLMYDIANNSAIGYKFITTLMENTIHQGVPVITGTLDKKDKAAMMKQYNAEQDPEIRAKIMEDWLKQ